MEILPAGTYRAHAGDKVLGYTTKMTPQVAVQCVIDSPGFEGQSITYYGYLSEGAYEYAIKSLRAMGFEGDDISDLSTVGKIPFSIVVQHEEYEGKISAKVVFVNSDGVAVKNVMSPDDVKKFAATMRSKIAALSPTVRSTPKAQPQKADHRSATAGDAPSDIPF